MCEHDVALVSALLAKHKDTSYFIKTMYHIPLIYLMFFHNLYLISHWSYNVNVANK